MPLLVRPVQLLGRRGDGGHFEHEVVALEELEGRASAGKGRRSASGGASQRAGYTRDRAFPSRVILVAFPEREEVASGSLTVVNFTKLATFPAQAATSGG